MYPLVLEYFVTILDKNAAILHHILNNPVGYFWKFTTQFSWL